MRLLQVLPGPAERKAQRGVGECREVVGDLLDADVALDIADQRAEHLGVVRAAKGVEQRLFVGLARALPGGMAFLEFGGVGGGIEAAVQQALVGELVDHAGVQHQVAHRPARQAEQAQQPRLHLGALDQHREVALAPQQRLEPVDEAGRGFHRALAVAHRMRGARDQAREAQLAVVAQHRDLRFFAQRLHACDQLRRQPVEKALAVDRLWRPAAAAAAAGAVAGGRGAAVVQQRIELGRDELPRHAEQVEQVAGGGGALAAARVAAVGEVAEPEAARDPREVGVEGRQQVGLLVVEVLDAVLDATQEFVSLGQAVGARRLHQPAGGEFVERLQGGARANLGELPAARHQQQLHDELDLADAAARELDVVRAFGPAGGAALRFFAHLGVQLTQALEDAVVEVAAVDERGDQPAQRDRAAVLHARAWRDDAAFQPGETLPLAALHLQVLLEHRHAHARRAGVAVRPQREVDAEHEAVFGGFADQRVEALADLRKILVRADAAGAVAALAAVGVTIFLVDVDQVDVGRHIEFARAELAHADDPEVDLGAGLVARCAVARVVVAPRLCERQVERGLGQRGHRAGHVRHRRGLLDVEHREPLQHQLARHPHRAGEGAAIGAQAVDQGVDAGPGRQAGGQQLQLGGVAAPNALHEAAVVGTCGGRRAGSVVRGRKGRAGTHGLRGGLC